MLNVSYGNLCPDNLSETLLGGLVFSDAPVTTVPVAAFAHVHMPRLDGQPLLCESLLGEGIVRSGQFGEIRYRFNDHLLFGVIVIDEEKTIPIVDTTASPLQSAAHSAYRQIFNVLHAQGFPYVLRFWNYMADINAHSHDLERYRQFNLGRQQAFTDSGQAVAGNVPAACALGTSDGPLTIAFLAARHPSVAIENPRQISAYDYPEQYGPRSPLFSRASVATLGTQRVLFLSGTASIVGHETLHADDITAQTAESIANIAAVLAEARRKTGAACQLPDLDYVVYIRHADHLEAVRQILQQQIGPEVKAAFVQADICRSDLLVEIEGSAILY